MNHGRRSLTLLFVTLCGSWSWQALAPRAAGAGDLDACLGAHALPRVARVVGRDARPSYVLVTAERDGIPSEVMPFTDASLPLAEALALAPAAMQGSDARVIWPISPGEVGTRICSPVPLAQAEIEDERKLVIAAGLNYAAHAEEAGGGSIFLFPKPSAPTPPYSFVASPADTVLLDYEVELGFVLLADVDLASLPTREGLLAQTAFFVANDVTDREPIIRHKALRGMGTGFVDAKGQATFMPIGPWMVRGTELFAALAACGAEGLGLRLEVDEGEGFVTRQASDTSRMLLDPMQILEALAARVAREGLRSEMPLRGARTPRYYPLAIEPGPRLGSGSIVLTGTPEGVALNAPDVGALILRGLRHLRGPIEQFRLEERERAQAGEPGGYLAAGDRMRASIDGLGSQIVAIHEPGNAPPPDPCSAP